MDEKPKSIWKKHFIGRTAWVIWLAVAVFTIMLCSFIIAFANDSEPTSASFLGAGILTGVLLVASLILIYVIWPLLRFLFWKHWRRTFFALACLATLIALLYAEEDWRGWHAWQKFKHEWEAKGEKFDFKDFIPPPVPDDQNFAMAPIWIESVKATLGPERSRQWFGDRYAENGRTNFTDRLILNIARYNNWNNEREPTNGYWAKGSVTDLAAWQAYYRAPVESNRNSTINNNEFPIAPHPQSPAQDVLLALSKYDSAT